MALLIWRSQAVSCSGELLARELDELRISLLPVADAGQESLRLARLIGQL